VSRDPRILSGGQRGVALMSSLLILLVLTIVALAMFRSFGLQEKIAANVRERQRAVHAAEGAQSYAEWWLGANSANTTVVCSSLLSANLGQGQICSNKLSDTVASVADVPWLAAGALVGVTYNPGNALTITTAAAKDTYYSVPLFYISDVGVSADGRGEIFQVDAAGYGSTANTVAVVESTLVVVSGVIDRGAGG
jgi:type IV pilus assembly protein PilX